MIVVDVYNLQKEKTSEIELKESIFDVPIKKHILHEVVVSQACSKRAGTSASQTRSEVTASGAKLFRQKGTGRARAGGASSPTRKGGGAAFGPSPRTYIKKVSKKVKKAALKMALTDKATSENLFIIDELTFPEIKTKNFVGFLKNFESRKALVVTVDKAENLEKSSQNVPRVKVMRYEGLNVYDILNYDHLFLEQAAVGKLQEALD